MEKRKTIVGFSAIVLLAFLTPFLIPAPQNTEVAESLEGIGYICAYGDFHDIGQNVFLGCSYNTVTNIAKNQTRDIRMNALNGTKSRIIAVNYTWMFIQLSTNGDATSATDATCPNAVSSNGLDIIGGVATEDYAHIGNYSLYHKFEATGTQAGIAKVCLHNGSATGDPLMASSLLASTVDLVANENLTIYYYMGWE